MQTVKKYLSLVKFSHTIFALPFAIIGFVLGVVQSEKILHSTSFLLRYGYKFLFVLICMITARNAAMAFNRYLDRNIDALNPRTAIREIPKGIITANNALTFVIVNCLIFIIATYCINTICFYLSPVALFVILFYSYTKRFTALCHLVLGLGLSLAPIGAFLAVVGEFELLPVIFSFIVLFWVSGFDIIYALQDESFDASQKLHSIPVYLGKSKALLLSRVLHIICALLIIIAGIVGAFNWLFIIGAIGFIAMLVFQQMLVKPNDLSKVNLAFMTANGIASVVFATFVIADVLMFKS
ncbi:MAG: UbiA-like polyprenyltransferase [Chitinophagaceae bacterium]